MDFTVSEGVFSGLGALCESSHEVWKVRNQVQVEGMIRE